MNFCDYFSSLLNSFNCCNTLNHGHGPSIGTLQLSDEDQHSSYTSSLSKSFLQFSLIGKNQAPETQETQRVTQILFTDDYFQSPDSITQQIWDAVDNNDIKAVTEFISSNNVSLLEDYDGFTLLHRSVIAGNTKMTEILLTKVEISAKDNVGRTALHYACMKNDLGIIKLLLTAKADPLELDSFGKIPLDYCKKNSESQKLFENAKLGKKISNSTEKILVNESKSRAKRKKIHSQYEESVKSRLNQVEANRKSAQISDGHQKVRKLTGPMEKEKSVSRIQDFIVIKLLGVGSLGEVYLVKDANKDLEYAMKIIEKKKLTDSGMFNMVFTDKKLLLLFDHPFIVPIIYSFQTKHKLVIVTYFCSGGILSEQLLQKRVLSLQEIQLYASEIIEALIYIHHKGYIYRGLTLKTVLLTDQGHIMLSNFQQSCEFSTPIIEKNTIFADENDHYIKNEEIDWLMLGKLLYELATGVQFSHEGPEIKDSILKDFIFKLLLPNDLKKSEILNHEFFQDICWEDVYSQKLNMPTPVGLDTYPQFTNLELSIAESFTQEKPIQNWSFIELDPST